MIKQDRALYYNQQKHSHSPPPGNIETINCQHHLLRLSSTKKNPNSLAIHLHIMTAPKLEKRFTMRIYLSKENTHDLGAMRNGPRRYIAAITRGSIKGEGLEAEILPGGADWVSVCIFPL